MAYMKAGQPWLYDDATGDIVGVKDKDNGDSYFAVPFRNSSGDITALIDPLTGKKIRVLPNIIRLSLSADQVLTAGSVKSIMSWGAAYFDTTEGGAWSLASPTKLIVPAGYSFARVVSQLRFTDPADVNGVPAGQNIVNHIQKNGTTTVPGMGLQDVSRGTTAGPMNSQAEFEWHPVTPGDYFETYAVNVSGSNLAVIATGRSWFYMELK